jgi:hypothetical protein
MSAETLIKVSLVILFLLYAYFMIGGYTPCSYPYSYPYPCSYSNGMLINNSQQIAHVPMLYPTNNSPIINSPINNNATNNSSDKNIYQMSPYLNF